MAEELHLSAERTDREGAEKKWMIHIKQYRIGCGKMRKS